MPGKQIFEPLYASGVLTQIKHKDFQLPTAQPWRNYVDFNKDLGVATDSKNLNEQLFKIMNYKDRTAKQRGYLGQKAIVRYLMSVVEDRGGADALAQMLTTKHDAEHGKLNRVGDNEYACRSTCRRGRTARRARCPATS